MKHFEKAVKFYYRSIEERNDFADPHYNLALLYMKMEEWEKAIKHFQLYIILDPNSIWSSIARKQIYRIKEIMKEKNQDDGRGKRGNDGMLEGGNGRMME